MAMLNIPSHNSDPNYRYKMPRLLSKVEGRGNGVKTNIMNMADIARALKRPPEYPAKFCGTELGAQSKYEVGEGKAIVNGAHETKDLQVLIDKFVEKYVLCPGCSLPEIDIVVRKGMVCCHCNACGHNGDLDNAHKLASFISRNPPKGESTMGGGGKGSTKAERREKKAGKGVEVAEDGTGKVKKSKKGKSSKTGGKKDKDAGGASHDSSDEAPAADEKKSKKGKAKKTKGAAAEGVLQKDVLGYDSDEIIDVQNRLVHFLRTGGQFSVAAKAASDDVVPATDGTATGTDTTAEAVEVESSKAVDECSSAAAGSVKCRPYSGVPLRAQEIKVTADTFFTELRVLQLSQDFDSVMRLFVTLNTLLLPDWKLGCEKIVVKAEMIDEHMPFLHRMIAGGMNTEQVCIAIEDFVMHRGALPASIQSIAFILHKLFNAEILDEDAIIARYQKTAEAAPASGVSGKSGKSSKNPPAGAHTPPANSPSPQVVTALQPFVTWLLEEDDADSSDDSESEVEVNTANRTTMANGGGSGDCTTASSSSASATTTTVDTCGKLHSPPGAPPTAVGNALALDADDDDDIDVDAI